MIPSAACRLKNKLEDLIDRLGEYDLLVSYVASPDPAKKKGHPLIRHIHDAIVVHLRRFGHHLPGTAEVPEQPADLQYTDLPWRMVWYPTKPTKMAILSDEEKLAIPSFNINSLERSPFSRGAATNQER